MERILQRKSEIYNGLTYPWGRRPPITIGEPVEVADGVFWVRFAMPGGLDHINLWLLRDGDGWTAVDTCLNMPAAQEQWESLFNGFMEGRPLRRVICTHMHPDHVGLAGWLCERFNVELWMSRDEFLMCRALASDTGRKVPPVALQFYHAAGFDKEQLQAYRKRFGGFGKAIYRLPDSYQRLQGGETFQVNDRYWQTVEGSGHSPEHMALYCPALKILISGDQILPRITPNVSVFPTEPRNDTLKEWLSSCVRIRDQLPDDLLVLPAHEAPFYGLHQRLMQIVESHQRDLHALYEYLEQPRRAVDCFPALFKRKINEHSVQLAIGESLAHLNWLVGRRMAERTRDADGVDWYVQKAGLFEDDTWS